MSYDREMFAKKFFIAVLLIGLLGNASVVGASTSSVESAEKVALLQQIQKLLVEVERLQALLAKQKAVEAARHTNYVPYDLVLFPISFESIYLVQEGELYAAGKTKTVREIDQQMFALFKKTVGKEAVAKHIHEWRVFRGELETMSAFVELVPTAGDWVVGVNREGFVSGDKETMKSFVDLYLHEYAHILLYEIPDFKQKYQNKFWTAADLRQVKNANLLSGAERFAAFTKYYEANSQRFVSEYSTSSLDEDMAETFVSFVRDGKPKGLTIREQKILAFYQESTMVSVREALQKNLEALGYFRD